MFYVFSVLSILISTTVGVIGFSQIFTALYLRKERGRKMTLLTIFIWAILFTLYIAAVILHFPLYQNSVFIALGVSLLLSFKRPKKR